jgi:hypothetical protein
MTASKPSRNPFDPHRDLSSAATDIELAGYLEDRLGLSLAEIKNITTMLGCDGASHEVWEELVARRRKAGA